MCIWNLIYGEGQGAGLTVSGAHLSAVLAHPAAARTGSLSWSPFGTVLATSSPQHPAVVVWNTATSENSQLWFRSGGGCHVVSWSPSGRHVVAAGVRGALRVWDAETWRWETWWSLPGACESAAWSDDGRVLLITCAFSPELHVLRTGEDQRGGSLLIFVGTTNVCGGPQSPLATAIVVRGRRAPAVEVRQALTTPGSAPPHVEEVRDANSTDIAVAFYETEAQAKRAKHAYEVEHAPPGRWNLVHARPVHSAAHLSWSSSSGSLAVLLRKVGALRIRPPCAPCIHPVVVLRTAGRSDP